MSTNEARPLKQHLHFLSESPVTRVSRRLLLDGSTFAVADEVEPLRLNKK